MRRFTPETSFGPQADAPRLLPNNPQSFAPTLPTLQPFAPPTQIEPLAPTAPLAPVAPPTVVRPPQNLRLKVEYEDEGGGASTALWVTLGLLVVGGVVFYLYPKFGKAATAAKAVVSGAPRSRRRRSK